MHIWGDAKMRRKKSKSPDIHNKAFKYRIYPTEEQEVLFAKTFGCTRFIYNIEGAYARFEALEEHTCSRVGKGHCWPKPLTEPYRRRVGDQRVAFDRTFPIAPPRTECESFHLAPLSSNRLTNFWAVIFAGMYLVMTTIAYC